MQEIKKLSHVSELPSWFKLENYNDAALLDIGGWHENLLWRKWLKEALSRAPDRFKSENEPKFIEDQMKQIMSDPIQKERRISIEIQSPSVEFLTPYTMGALYNELNEQQIETLNIELNREFTSLEDLEKSHKEHPWMIAPLINLLPDYDSVPVMVDIHLPDELIIEEFKKWLKDARKTIDTFSKTKRARQQNFDLWISAGVLPYIDLSIWSETTRTAIPDRVYADAIFPRGDGGEDKVRKTTRPIAENLLDSTGALAFIEGRKSTKTGYSME